ncbi:MAG: VWA domain-containing protein [Planctomycetes bacterium]|nr:VWA domain-containing protein [Planctomycetota bacterium]
MLATALFVSLLTLIPIQEDETVKDFKKFFRKSKDPVERVELILSLEDVESPDVAKVMLPLLKGKDPAEAQAALRIISQLKEPTSRVPLLPIIEEGKPEASCAAIAEAVAMGGWKEFQPLLLPQITHKSPDVRLWVVTALGRLGDPLSIEVVARLAMTDAEPMVRVASVDSLALIGHENKSVAGPALVAALQDKHLSVATAACLALRRVRVIEAIPPLLDLREFGEGRILEMVYPTLIDLTDLNLRDDPATWRSWWERAQANGYELPSDAEVLKRRVARAKANEAYRFPTNSSSFVGVPTTSRQIVFVIDVSGSMEDNVIDKDSFRERGFEHFRKLDIVREELRRTIDGLDEGVFFNIISFASDMHPWKKKMTKANALARKSAIAWVDKLKPLGGKGSKDKGRTNTYGALLAGLGVKDSRNYKGPVSGSVSKAIAGAPDTLFFLSDGRPTVGELVEVEDIRASITHINQFRRTVIHTIGIGEFQKSFLVNLSRENNGVFVDLGR